MTFTTLRTTRLSRLAVLAAVSTVALAACSSTSASTAADSTTVTDPWVKTVDEGMTAAFGVITNTSGEDITIVSATTDAAPTVELHETAMGDDGAMSMSPIDGGFVVPAGGSLTLEPGSFHIMLMGVTEPIRAGDDVNVTLTFSDDSTLDVTATAKDFTGANEDYDGGDTMDGMDMGHDSTSPSADSMNMEGDS
ncbi:copper chaperone PCu(A)C [Demequina aurantiaca]|uniref:copper chaperone PCu(A)C n=1 Tax=Demequina aurantiaca TaxID=676200 RepID=UPI0007856325|nr:copper chaperone PCu(A)C [Demequina aurantiaca]